ncbi:unnamed protein product [Cylindrotheca closterium]|uniref:Uncharacterized protein n=1 Tax=Cylindrotheca closterium TaxID=2856 RepID=A0AAD2G4P6_9STRA|nr:unnamed protein product [Cylindrotheca closterium]
MSKNTKADIEKQMATPNKKPKNINTDVSPAKTAPLTPTSPHHITIDVDQRPRSAGVFAVAAGIKGKILVVGGLALIGALAYFGLQWFESTELEAQIKRLEGEVNRLHTENNRYEVLNKELNITVDELKDIGVQINDTANELEETNQALGFEVAELEAQNQIFAGQNERLSKTTSDLNLISGFINETADAVNDTFDQIMALIEQQIVQNSVVLMNTLQNTFRDIKDGWNCDYRGVFVGRAYAVNSMAAIPSTEFDGMMDYVSERVLDELCLDRTDFTMFLGLPEYRPLNTNRLNAAVTIYTERAIDWYFPEDNETGLTQDDWFAADFKCKNLNATQRYRY